MKSIVVNRFGGPEVLEIIESPSPSLKDDEVLVKITSIGLNHADLMGRRGEYKLSTGEPPFILGLEAGGIISAIGNRVLSRFVGERVILHPSASRKNEQTSMQGTYRTEIPVKADDVIPAPSTLPDNQLGSLWLTYLTAWGCLIWKEQLQPGKFVAIPAASSGVGMAAAQIVKNAGGIPIGLTTSKTKKEKLLSIEQACFDHIVVTNDDNGKMIRWHKELQSLTGGHGIDVFFDPVASGDYLNTEIRSLAQHGTIWIYGLLGAPGAVDVTPLIRKYGAIKGWLLNELLQNKEAAEQGTQHILSGIAKGTYKQHIENSFSFDNVCEAHTAMEQGSHIGKLVLEP